MLKSVLFFLTVVIVSARCSAESIPALNKTSGIAVAPSTQAGEHDKQNSRLDDVALNEERGTFEIESFRSSVKIPDEYLPRTFRAANIMDVPRIEESNKALAIRRAGMMDVSEVEGRNKELATQMEKLGINLDHVVYVAMLLLFDTSDTFKQFSLNNLEWMVLGKVYFEKAGVTGFKSLSVQKLFQATNTKIIDDQGINEWTQMVDEFKVGDKTHKVGADTVFGKTLWLVQNHNVHLADAVKMAFGSELFNKEEFAIVDGLLQAVNVDKDVTEGPWEVNEITPNNKREPFLIESFTSSVKIPVRTNPAANMMDVSHIKEHNKELATRMEKLGIDIDVVVAIAKAIASNFKRYSLNNLEWMVLGKLYFDKAGVTAYESLGARDMFHALNIKIVDENKLFEWSGKFHDIRVKAKSVFGKMLWLIRDDKLNVHLADAAKMAFGSELFNEKQLPISDSLIETVTKKKIDKDAMESLIQQDKEAMRKKIAKDKRLKKATRKYVGGESQEQPNKKRKK